MMNDVSSAPGSEDHVLAQFLQEIDAAADPEAVKRRYYQDYPHLVAELKELLQVREQVDRARPTVAVEEVKPGDWLGEFRIVRKIGQGGMGVIYEAIQESLGRPVAVKTIRRGHISPGARARFLREQRVLARLHQTHIVPIHTAGQAGPLQYFAMPYIEGAGLNHLIHHTLRQESTAPWSRTPSLAELAGKLSAESRGNTKVASGTVGATGAVQAAPSQGNASDSKADAVPPPVLLAQKALSLGYFRSVAQVMADAAEAVAHAHGVRILHRDLKPSNILVDKHGQCWLIDFGLAGYFNGQSANKEAELLKELEPEPVSSTGIQGTPQYMAPEQFQGRADVRTDVWGLGVTLYELITLRRAFDGPSHADIRTLVEKDDPPPVRKWIDNVPADLAAICRKAIQKDPGQRYPGAGAFAEDLRRWLRHEPTVARPARTPRRMFLWARRNKGWAFAIGAVLTTFLALVGGVLDWFIHQADVAEARAVALAAKVEVADSRTELANERAVAANELAAAEKKNADAQRRAALLLQIQQLRFIAPRNDWSRQAWRKVEDVALGGDLGRDQELADQAAATLVGLDAAAAKRIPFEASSVVFDRTGKRLLFGGMAALDSRAAQPAQVWDSTTDHLLESQQPGDGPVAFRAEGTPLQLVRIDPWNLALWEVSKHQIVSRLTLPGKNNANPKGHPKLNALRFSGDGALAAAAATMPDGQDLTLVWEGASGRLLQSVPRKANVLAFSPDNQVLALGNDEGRLELWSVRSGKPLGPLQESGLAIESLAFSPDANICQERNPAVRLIGRLAVGDGSATIAIWDLVSRHPIAHCRGSSNSVDSLAFSPDGLLLASAGRFVAKLWDSFTGQLLLDLEGDSILTGVSFSPEGNRLAVSSSKGFGAKGRVQIWDLQHGRGIQTLRGLTGQVAQLRFSPNGHLLAALTHSWQVAVWNIEDGQLRFKRNVPPGWFVGNASLEFSPDGTRLAFAGYKDIVLWEARSGEQLHSWAMAPSLTDKLAFRDGKLVSLRVETKGGKVPPFTEFPPAVYPRICWIRELSGRDPNDLKAIEDFNAHVFDCSITADGRFCVIEGQTGRPGEIRRWIKAFDGRTGAKLWELESRSKHDRRYFWLDPAGGHLLLNLEDPRDDKDRMPKVELLSGKLIGTVSATPEFTTFSRLYWLENSTEIELHRRQNRALLVRLGIDKIGMWPNCFNAAETHLAWGNTDGTVNVCDLQEVQHRLAQVGLGW
jgi:serine/threonine protein kinase/WD40 repeat protein